jgi:hypothetical protein
MTAMVTSGTLLERASGVPNLPNLSTFAKFVDPVPQRFQNATPVVALIRGQAIGLALKVSVTV